MLMKLNIDFVYPIGAIYLSSNSVNPNLLFGGTWEQISGRFLVGAGSWTDGNNNTGSFTNGVSGGEYKHTLIGDEIPSHTHTTGGYTDAVGAGEILYVYAKGANSYGNKTSSSYGGGQAHNNIPPYFAVYIWKRIA